LHDATLTAAVLGALLWIVLVTCVVAVCAAAGRADRRHET